MSQALKIVIGGAGGVGKTTYLHRFVHGNFCADTALTVGVAFITKSIQRNGKSFSLTMWDLGGQDRFRFVQGSYVLGARAGIVFFDMSRPSTLLDVREWVSLFRKNAGATIPIMLGGTKMDCVRCTDIESTIKQASDIVSELGLAGFVPTSSKEGTNVDELMLPLIDRI
ncbi:MAG: GTP-binding protein [Candidatus Lokiarchaeota archaeon]|nr:GTP-binding protein [Candidatus Lokiarchaeota archaeon]